MMPDQQEVLSRFHQVLVETSGSRYSRDRSASLTVYDIYYNLVPFQDWQDELGLESVLDYERALLRLLAGQGGFLEMESLADRQKLQRLVDSGRPDPGLIRDYLSAGVCIRSRGDKESPEVEEAKDLPHFEDCPSCSDPLPQQAGVNFCPFCGTDVRRVLCVSCEEKLKLEWRYCIACGTEVEKARGALALH
jgi:hypothetical protein